MQLLKEIRMLLLNHKIRQYFWPSLGIVCIIFFIHLMMGTTNERKQEKDVKASLIVPPREVTASVDRTKSIPKIIHQTWKSYNIPELMGPWVKTWVEKNPDWEYWFWTDEDIQLFMDAKFRKYVKFFNSYPDQAYRNDAFRYFLLAEYGGVYIDLDMEAVKPLNSVISQYGCVLSQEPQEHAHFLSPMGVPLVSNALMGCRPNHPFFVHVIGDLKSYAGFFDWNDVLKATGPYFLTENYKGYTRKGLLFSAPSGDADVHLAEADVFQPTTDQSMRDHMQQVCLHSEGHDFLSAKYLKWQKKLCTNIRQNGFLSGPTENSVSIHHWTHTWAGKRADPWNILNNPITFDVRQLKKLLKNT